MYTWLRMIVLKGGALPSKPVMALSAREYVAVFFRDMIYQGFYNMYY
jgi:hypothetical protein